MTITLTFILILAQLADAALTYAIIKRGGYEQNRLLVRLADFLSRYTKARWAWLAYSKGIVCALLWFATWAAWDTWWFQWELGAVTVLTLAAVVHNVIEFRKQRRAGNG